MQLVGLTTLLLALSSLGYAWGRRRALSLADRPGSGKLHSRPVHYGGLVALWVGVPAAAILLLWLIFNGGVVERLVLASVPSELLQAEGGHVDLLLERIRQADPSDTSSALGRAAARMDELQSRSVQFGFVLVSLVAAAGLLVTVRRIHPRLRARNEVEWLVGLLLAGCSVIAILTTIGIVLSVLFEALRFFQEVPFTEFLFGTTWSPQTAIRSDQVGSSGAFGAVPLFAGTLMISAIAMLVSVPVGLMSAIYLAEYASKRVRAVAKPVLEILAGVPTVVYGFFAALTVAPALRNAGVTLGLDVSSESALAAGLVMGIMIIPFISSLSDDVITAVPESLRSGSLGLGATHSETIRKVVLPAALPGIVGGILLGVSRAIGETMIVVMAAGLAANLTANPLESVTTVTVQIVTLLVGDQEFDSPKTLAAFALGLVLFVMTLLLNVLALYVVRKYREQYD